MLWWSYPPDPVPVAPHGNPVELAPALAVAQQLRSGRLAGTLAGSSLDTICESLEEHLGVPVRATEKAHEVAESKGLWMTAFVGLGPRDAKESLDGMTKGVLRWTVPGRKHHLRDAG